MTQQTFTLPPQYRPQDVEAALYHAWLARGLFTARADSAREPYVIVIPPPNVTAILHMGHGLDNVVQDVLIRLERMRGREALWLPGTDHAGIATQNVVERILAQEGKTRFDLGREQFVACVWEHVRATGETILEQLKVIGASCDWTRTRFTLDDAYSRAVREAFVRLWEQDLVYRGHRVIHWCPRCLTALSDEEAEFHDTTGTLYHIRYPLVAAEGAVTVATTRPETMLGDTAVAVHPADRRYRTLVGQRVRLPIVDVEIPVVADDAVDPTFGTGVVKVTPAHDAADFEIGTRHGLEMPLVMAEDGRMEHPTRVPKSLAGLDRFDAREKIVKMLEAQGLLATTEQHQHAVRQCYRCDSVVEPRLSDQWFVRMKPLADPVLAGFRRGEFRIVPDRWVATFEQWMENIRDWNISRQLWWGHRIPMFSCAKCGHAWADRRDPVRCPKCGGPVEQDPDVLDTWFSSWLWPFATLGWPEKTRDLARFYPGHTLVTGPDILFFWVARMLMAGYHFMGATPFRTVFLHGIVRDAQRRKMSKSLGNGIDPLDVVRLFGADALRWTVIAGMALGQDLTLDPNDLATTFAPGRNFANKLWNIGRFILAQLPDEGVAIDQVERSQLTLADRWILTRASHTVWAATGSLEQFRLDEAAKRCYDFAWKELADWYVEAVKPRLGVLGEREDASLPPAGTPPSAAVGRRPRRSPTAGSGAATAAETGGPAGAAPGPAVAQAVLAHCFDTVLRLLHPVVPFITEALWQKLPGRAPGELLAAAEWPDRWEEFEDADADLQFERVKQVIEKIRSIRAEYRIAPKARLRAVIVARGSDRRETFEQERQTIIRLAWLSELSLDGTPRGPGANVVFGDGSEVFVPLEGALVQQECRRLSDELARVEKQLQTQAGKLANPNFVSRAPEDVISRERAKEREWDLQRSTLVTKLKALGCS